MKIHLLLLLLAGCNLNKPLSTQEENLWNVEDIVGVVPGEKIQHPTKAKYYSLSRQWIEDIQKAGRTESQAVFIRIPDPTGEMRQFKIWDSGVIAQALADKYPNMRTYKGYEIGRAKNRIRMEVPGGSLTAQVMSELPWLISSYNYEIYQAYFLTDLPLEEKEFFERVMK